MQTFSMFFSEDAGEKFNKMSDDQFSDWKKANPGAAKKADQLRAGKKSSGLQSNDGETKKIEGSKGGALAKHRKSEMGKWSQGIKNAPKDAAKKAAGALAKKAGSALVKKASSAITKRDDIKNVDVNVDEPKKKVEDEKQAIGNRSTPKSDMADKQRARINKNGPVKVPEKAKKAVSGIKKGAGVIANIAKKLAAKSKTGERGIAGSGNLEGLSGRSKGLIN